MKYIVNLLLAALSILAVHGDIKPKQTLQITITGVPTVEQGRLNGAYPVSADGYIDMWKIGRVKAAGLKSAQLASSIANKFRTAQIYSDPVFQVLNRAASEEEMRAKQLVMDTKRFTVGGQVQRPGQQQWTEGTTLYAAVQSAGGPSPFGAVNRVKLFRNGKVYVYNLKVDAHKSLVIYAGDQIEVPQKNWINR